MTSLDLSEPSPPPVAPAAVPVAEPPGPDLIAAAAVDRARAAALDTGGQAVGAHLGVDAEPDSAAVVTHRFEAVLPGYRGWHWAVTVARAEDSDVVTVDDVVLLPSAGALLAPAWVPWNERVRPGDLSPGELLPPPEDDIRLVPAYADAAEDPQEDLVALELGLGREQVLSRDGRLFAADRWQGGDHGPDTPMARQAPAHCGTCGFLVPLAGSLRAGFGVCANEAVEADGSVVSVEFGCGAHSQVRAPQAPPVEVAEVVWDDGEDVLV